MTQHATRGPQYPSRVEVEQAIDDLPDSYIECRDFQHRWVPHSARWVDKERVFDRVLRCTRCKTKKIQVLSEYGSILRSHYEYPENYLLKDLGRIVGDGRDAIRLASITRRLGKNGG